MPMLFQSSLLFLAALLGGMAVLVIRNPSQSTFQWVNVLSGSYLFAITVLHLLPELFAMPVSSQRIGFYILVGFFLQLLLELLSKGIEHGHMEAYGGHPQGVAPFTLLLALCIHAFLDGVILSSPHDDTLHHQHTHGAGGLLIGILFHKVPVAFALTSVLRQLVPAQRTVIGYLLLFAVASPLGLWASHYCSQQSVLSGEGWVALWSIATGSFLHIATTIFFEASPSHQPDVRKFVGSLAGASVAIVFELLL